VNAAALEVTNLTVSFPHDGGVMNAIENVNLSVDSGQLLVVIGPSGGGKSTLLNAIAGLVAPSEGTITAHGETVTGPGRDRGVVFQRDTAFPWMRVADNVGYSLRARGVPRDERESTVAHYIESVGLSGTEKSWPKQLSGGMRKRVSVAAAFASDPEILLMDEPFGSLDFVTKLRLQALALKLWSQTRKTIVFVTHDVDEALTLADRIVVISRGHLVDDLAVQFGRPRTDDLRADPKAIALRRYLLGRLGLEEIAAE
jgi:NitT/TauT family transport system ATP-binding protein